MNAEHNLKSTLAVLALSLLAFALTATPALAAQARLFTGSFGSITSSTVDPYPLAESWGIAADSAAGPSQGDVYVSDGANHRVEKFDSAGNFLLTFGKEVNKTAVEAARPEAEQNLCPAPGHPSDVCQSGTAGTAPGAFGGGPSGEPTIMFVAVDNSPAGEGDVYVADYSDSRVTKLDESGHLVASWATAGQLTGSAAPGGPFDKPAGLAVDSSGNLFVYDGTVFVFNREGKFSNEFAPQVNKNLGTGIAIDPEGNFYLASSSQVLKYDSAGIEVGVVTQAEGFMEGLAVDPASGDLYVKAQIGEPETIQRFDSTCHPETFSTAVCTPAETFSSPYLPFGHGLALDPSTADALYAVRQAPGEVAAFAIETVPDVLTLKPSAVSPTTATLAGTVNPAGVELKEGLEGCRFEWGEGEGATYEHVAPCDKSAAQIGSGTAPVAVHAAISPLQAAHTYHYRLVAGNANDVNSLIDEPVLGQDIRFGPPRIASTSASAVTATSATVEAEVNPQNLASSYRFEYLTEAAYLANGETFAGALQAPLEPAPLGSGGSDVAVSQHLQGLAPHTAYRYRVAATNPLGASEGQALLLTTQTPAAFVLPDARGWELVSPPDKHGATIFPIGLEEGLIQAAAAGGAFAFSTNAPTEAEPQGYTNSVQVLAGRSPGGWSSRDLTVAHEAATGLSIGAGQEYRFFSEDLSKGVIQPFGAFSLSPPLSPQATEQSPFLHSNYLGADPSQFCTSSCFEPLVTAANTAAGVQFGEEGRCPGPAIVACGPKFLGATPDLGHIVVRSSVGLTETEGDKGGLYEWSAGQLQLISILPPSSGGKPATPGDSQALGYRDRVARRAISPDGQRVVWSTNGGHLYLRDLGKEETVELDKGLSGEPEFQTANAQTTKIFFSEQGALYLYDSQTGERTTLAPANAGVQGAIAGASEDGTYLYLVANGELGSGEGAVSGNCHGQTSTPANRCNLYELHESGGAWGARLVAVLSGEDFPDFSRALPGLTARVSPNGQWLAFMSQQPLTKYDNRDAVSGQPDEEVYLYHAAAGEGGEGTLFCASCNPTGARPRGVEYGGTVGPSGHPNMPLAGGDRVWEPDAWLAANIPGWTPYRLGTALYQSRYLSDSGRLFFNSSDALVPQDSNGTEDVYQYEPPQGEGAPPADTCTTASPTYSPASQGCVDLISSGTSPEESAFLDASESGTDVFFLTRSQLAKTDADSSLDVYDARTNGGFPEAVKPVECSGDACQPPAVPPNDATPGSLRFEGFGNEVQCSKSKVKKSGKCVAKHHKKKHPKKNKKKTHKRANNHRRAGK